MFILSGHSTKVGQSKTWPKKKKVLCQWAQRSCKLLSVSGLRNRTKLFIQQLAHSGSELPVLIANFRMGTGRNNADSTKQLTFGLRKREGRSERGEDRTEGREGGTEGRRQR